MNSPADQLRKRAIQFQKDTLAEWDNPHGKNVDMIKLAYKFVEDIDQYTANAVRAAEKKAELYGRLHQVIELFQQGDLSAKSYSLLHDSITERISVLNKETKG